MDDDDPDLPDIDDFVGLSGGDEDYGEEDPDEEEPELLADEAAAQARASGGSAVQGRSGPRSGSATSSPPSASSLRRLSGNGLRLPAARDTRQSREQKKPRGNLPPALGTSTPTTLMSGMLGEQPIWLRGIECPRESSTPRQHPWLGGRREPCLGRLRGPLQCQEYVGEQYDRGH